ncbi:MAG TPA: FAD-dependent oxidoreductase [Sandaracinaceae bacterium LLY-WYZ-13_1]|nr:FAD-dependent oxidoreductase [Sandaracinaceae bacterium LLY-WYZ-13_1]
MTQHVAIVGTGPAGFYCAEAICKKAPEVRIDLIDRLPTPFGLVRSGVAPDHQGTKNVWRVFHRTAHREQVRFLGNVEVGRDVSVAELLELYDAVVLAVGATVDRKLGIEGEDLLGVYGSGAFTSWYNGHPDFAGLSPELKGPGIAVIGNGNVAVDVVRVLSRSRPEMVKTDIPDYAMEAIEASDYTDVYMLGRRGPMDASFTTAELRELGDMTETVAVVDPAQLPDEVVADDPKQQKLKEKILKTLRGYSENDPASKSKRLHLKFFSAPVRILGESRVEGLEVAVTEVRDGRAVQTGETYTLDVGTVITAIGYTAIPLEGVDIADWGTCYANEDGKIEDRLWAVGWAKRGPSGVIATNRKDSGEVAHMLLDQLEDGGRKGGEGLDHLLAERGADPVLYEDWERIDEHETSSAPEGSPRRKLTTMDDLIGAARSKG